MSGDVTDDAVAELVGALGELGFTRYEARCYVGLLAAGTSTGYGLAKQTGVPTPKVYETLRRLIVTGAVVRVSHDPDRFEAIPSAELIERLSGRFSRSLHQAQEAVRRLGADESSGGVVTRDLPSRAQVIENAHDAIATAERRVYLSASEPELVELWDAVCSAADRGVAMVVLRFGHGDLAGGRGITLFSHDSTEDAIYRHHQARHLALVADSRAAVNAVAADGHAWAGVVSRHAAVVAAVKGMIKHDIDLQEIYRDFGPELVARYGPGLQALEAYRRERSDVTGEAAAG